MVPLVMNHGEFMEALEEKQLVNEKYTILEKLQEEIYGVDNSIYQELSFYHHAVNEDGDYKSYHFYFAVIPEKQNKVTGNPKNAILGLEFRFLVAVL
ncbi:hypothetical protein [Oceanobacillus polygoni]|uniref:Uncharacterized protein n=1 Tax=Oceanobacillus polygoni TaxID=1235259 RepID=A0A9X0Z016_9BACI|nr:hypothetical protein [Oceanobacillus polygoni]MBP2079640.1 hypothetical protein [Oceanobacillus polygoni]